MRKIGGASSDTVFQEQMPGSSMSTFVNASSYKPPEMSMGSATLAPKVGGKKPKTPKTPKTPKAKTPKAKTTKKGGDLISDVKGLAVPFAILLAKQGLEMAMDKKKKSPEPTPASKPKSLARRRTVGGDCTTCNKKGGSDDVKERFAKLSKEIDNFLKKY